MARISEGTLVLLWALVIVEFISPIPAALTWTAAWVLLARPPWFLRLIQGLYSDR